MWLYQPKHFAQFYPVFYVVCDFEKKCICILKTMGTFYLKQLNKNSYENI